MAEDKKVDLRIKKTQLALVNAMFTLLEDRKFAKITVNDLCTEAMISRSAFYVHFEDKYSLLHFCMSELKIRLFEETGKLNTKERIKDILHRIKSNIKVYKNLMMSELDAELMEMMRQSFHADFEKLLKEKKKKGIDLPGPPEIISTYIAAGIASAITFWISQNMPYSIDEMAECLYCLLPKNAS